MDFGLTVTEFPSFIHRCVYATARGLTPPEISLAGIADPELRASCRSFYDFLVAMLSDMYDHPEAYRLPVGALEAFCGGRRVNGVLQKFPARTKSLLAQARNSAYVYLSLLWHLGRRGQLAGEELRLRDEDRAAIAKAVKTAVSPISLDARLEALGRVGLEARGDALVSVRYPGLFPALCALAQRAERTAGFDFFAFTCAEFRNIAGKGKPTYEDYFRPLPPELRERALELHAFAVENRLAPTISTFWKVDYKYRGTQVMCVASNLDCALMLDVRITCTYDQDDPARINDRLSSQPTEFQRLALRHVWRCTGCSTSHLGRFVTVLGKRQRVCGGGVIGFRWANPDAEDIEAIRRLIRMRMEIIEDLRAEWARGKRA